MRSWSYTYKTSDGLRHEAEMSAPSKDDVYAALRARGIRAIRVDERIAPIVRKGFRGLRKRDWLLAAGVFLVLLCALSLFALRSVRENAVLRPDPSVEAQLAVHPALREIQNEVDAVMSAYRRELGGIDVELLSNYALIQRTSNLTEFVSEIEKGRALTEKGKAAIRDVFSRLYESIPESHADERDSAKRLYGTVLDEIESGVESFDGDALALELLDKNRDKWRVVRGEVQWSDDTIAREFSYFRRPPRGTVTHWERDFSSRKNALPGAKKNNEK